MREEKELEGIDPNSEEALRKCKYLRVKDDDQTDTLDSPFKITRRGGGGDKTKRGETTRRSREKTQDKLRERKRKTSRGKYGSNTSLDSLKNAGK